ncbi:hypothetical protein GQ53DRAFT_743189 [Thozetella sp. PMI_491]|nr:hypothetical protein GQ53DRAFT_743189 [Thozetella sp. PMI_491]
MATSAGETAMLAAANLPTDKDCPHANPQDQCILFRLPLEARQLVYEYVLVETEVENGCYVTSVGEVDLEDVPLESATKIRPKTPQSKYWPRPGCTTRTKIDTVFLRSCRRIYDEAHLLPSQLRHYRCAIGPRPGIEPGEYFKGFTTPQLSAVRTLQLFIQQHAIDSDGGDELREQLKGIEPNLRHLTMTLRHNANVYPAKYVQPLDAPVLINPFRLGLAIRDDMLEDMEAIEGGENLAMPTTGWAGTFARLPALQTLTIEFDHDERFAEDLKRLAHWANKWRFPLRDGYVLVSDASPKRRTWRGLLGQDMPRCTNCQRPRPTSEQASLNCLSCKWRRLGKGPRMITWSITWTARQGDLFEDMSIEPRPVKPPKKDATELERWDPRLGGLNSILNYATPVQLEQLASWGVI